MGTISEKLQYTLDAVNDIQNAINNAGVTVSDDVELADYANLIAQIQTNTDITMDSSDYLINVFDTTQDCSFGKYRLYVACDSSTNKILSLCSISKKDWDNLNTVDCFNIFSRGNSFIDSPYHKLNYISSDNIIQVTKDDDSTSRTTYTSISTKTLITLTNTTNYVGYAYILKMSDFDGLVIYYQHNTSTSLNMTVYVRKFIIDGKTGEITIGSALAIMSTETAQYLYHMTLMRGLYNDSSFMNIIKYTNVNTLVETWKAHHLYSNIGQTTINQYRTTNSSGNSINHSLGDSDNYRFYSEVDGYSSSGIQCSVPIGCITRLNLTDNTLTYRTFIGLRNLQSKIINGGKDIILSAPSNYWNYTFGIPIKKYRDGTFLVEPYDYLINGSSPKRMAFDTINNNFYYDYDKEINVDTNVDSDV